MVTILTGQNGRHVLLHVVSASRPVTEHALTRCLSLAGSHVKSRAWVCQMKPNIATCGNAEVGIN